MKKIHCERMVAGPEPIFVQNVEGRYILCYNVIDISFAASPDSTYKQTQG